MKITQPNKLLETIATTLKDKSSLLLATHIYPDGDALGSQLALGNILESLGKKVFYFSESGCSHIYNFLPDCHKLDSSLPDLSKFDAVIALDCGDRLRLGREMERLLQVHPFIVIDHHAGHKNFGDIRWVDDSRSSTGEMVYELAVSLKAEISSQAAYCLYTAIVSDTGSFKYDSTSARTFMVAGELVARGVNPSDVAGKLFDNYSPNRLYLLQKVLMTLELHAENRIGIITVTREMFAKTETTQEDTEDFISFPRALSLVQVAIFIKEGNDAWISVSLRSKGKNDVASVARKFGGGGHRNAAGFRLMGYPVDKIRQKIVQEVVSILNEPTGV